ncbi:hypothetical protein V8E54_008872 [Elaphomyces granulatus]
MRGNKPQHFAAYSLQAEEGELNLTLEELIDRSPNNSLNGAPDLYQRQRECSACNGRHNVEKCRNLFEELRPDGWVVHEHQERRCQQYLKTAEGRALYKEPKKHFAAHGGSETNPESDL